MTRSTATQYKFRLSNNKQAEGDDVEGHRSDFRITKGTEAGNAGDRIFEGGR